MAKVYVIEDDGALRAELVRLLAREGYEVEECHDFPRAAELALAAVPDLVLLDLTLPGTDGQLVCREIRAVLKTKGRPGARDRHAGKATCTEVHEPQPERRDWVPGRAD